MGNRLGCFTRALEDSINKAPGRKPEKINGMPQWHFPSRCATGADLPLLIALSWRECVRIDLPTRDDDRVFCFERVSLASCVELVLERKNRTYLILSLELIAN